MKKRRLPVKSPKSRFIIHGNNAENTVDVFVTIEIISQWDAWQEIIAVTDLQYIKQIQF